jgi:hypothetical protein
MSPKTPNLIAANKFVPAPAFCSIWAGNRGVNLTGLTWDLQRQTQTKTRSNLTLLRSPWGETEAGPFADGQLLTRYVVKQKLRYRSLVLN